MFTKAAELTGLLCQQSPCNLCGREFKHSHTCIVLSQVALLWLQDLTPEVKDRTIRQCAICQHTCDTVAALHRHLKDSHQLQVHDFVLARDGLHGGSACSHCGQTFATREGLKRHILDGRCEHFDCTAPNVTREPEVQAQVILKNGNFQALYSHPAFKLELSLRCQFCPERYARQIDLAAHLIHQHSDLWYRAQDSVRLLLQVIYSKYGCCCNPSVSDRSLSHICLPIRQMAMIYESGSLDVLAPVPYDPALMRGLLAAVDFHPVLTMILTLLQERYFATLWTSPAVLSFLQQHCLLCGGYFHTGASCMHLARVHRLDTQLLQHYVPQVVAGIKRVSTCDWKFFACNAVFNTPMAADEVGTELATSWLCLIDQIYVQPTGQELELLATFQHLSPLLQEAAVYQHPKDEERTPKKAKQSHQPQGNTQERPQAPLLSMIKLMAQLLIQHDKTLEAQKRLDSFVFFMKTEPHGIHQFLVAEAMTWKKKAEETPEQSTPFRAHLLVHMMGFLQQRVLALSKCQPGDQLWDQALQSKTIMADGSWPFLKWDSHSQTLIHTKQEPLTMQKLLKELGYLIGLLKDHTAVQRFHSLRPQPEVVAWSLQVNIRADEVWQSFQLMASNTCWGLMACTMKVHSQQVSRPAQNLMNLMGKGQSQLPQKGRAKGQSKGKTAHKGGK
eukprot:s1590_g10.t1